MTRLRALAALLGCLAILAGSFSVVAAASPARTVLDRSGVQAEPCSHCDDCDGVPCPNPAAACVQAHASASPALAVVAVELLAVDYSAVSFPPRTTTLSGLSPSPDPFPPRS
jgi:hypothetical protein